MIASPMAYFGGVDDADALVVVDLATICETAVDDAIDHGHDVIHVGPDHLPVLLRRSAVRRALGDLLDAAVKVGRQVTVRLDADEVQVTIAVEDDGSGTAPDLLDRVREPFGRGGAGTRRRRFGLGLAIVARMVAAEIGALHLSNRAGGLRAAIMLTRNTTACPMSPPG